ncbi:hypothetical protein J2741_002210 [Methanolinea mesophila]|uniref:2'-5' RNA ligase family protein n=1 Tax=Methanolinea mesophila TaxID=547055 RepID=UPI001AE439A6|nr:2'-5' RNA ligase family protein [Methanolinea mesophila]MBP1929663.1 hypothetical protein [Methanolinea mesophila]
MAVGWVRRVGRRLLSRRSPEVRYLILVRVLHPCIAGLMHDLATTFFLSPSDMRMPHITLFGPFTLEDPDTEREILDCIAGASADIHETAYSLGELLELQGRKGKAVVWKVILPEEMKTAYREISVCLFRHAGDCTWLDREPDKRVIHITLAFNLPAPLAFRIREHVLHSACLQRSLVPGRICDTGAEELQVSGIAVIRNGALWKEYDLATKTWKERKDLFTPC